MKSLLIVALATGLALAEGVIDFTKIPECARQCAILQQADANCVPPAALVTDQATYQSCVCQSALLPTLKSSGALCQPFCSPEDATAISKYYNDMCNAPPVIPAGQPTATETNAAEPTTTDSAATNTATVGAGTTTPNTSNQKTSWFESHWRWVVFAIVVGLAFLFFLLGGFWLRRHLHRKRELAAQAAVHPTTPFTPPSRIIPPSRDGVPSPVPMAMAGPRNLPNNPTLDSNINGIAPPRASFRSRRSTLQSINNGVSSREHSPHPVVWGPHQHQASRTDSPSPSPAVSHPQPIYRHHEASYSDPRFLHYKATPSNIEVRYTDRGSPIPRTATPSRSPLTQYDGDVRPSSAREPGRTGEIRHSVRGGYQNNPRLSDLQAQSAEIVENQSSSSASGSPSKLRKAQV